MFWGRLLRTTEKYITAKAASNAPPTIKIKVVTIAQFSSAGPYNVHHRSYRHDRRLALHEVAYSIIFAKRKGHVGPLSAAQLEMMNLSGDGSGFDMIIMPAAWASQVPTANFFLQGGYEENSVVVKNNIVSTLLAVTDYRMDKESVLPGAKDLAAAFELR